MPFGVLFCIGDPTNCVTGQQGSWSENSAVASGPLVPTGNTVSKVLPLTKDYPGKLVVTGFDADGHELGSFKASFDFKATNTLRFADLANAFANRPDHLKLEAHFTTKRRDEALSLMLGGGLADNTRLNFGDYAWLNPEQTLRARMAKLQAEHTAALAAAEQARAQAEAAAEEQAEAAQRAAEEQQETDQDTAVVGALLGGMVAAKSGNAAAGSALAQMAGVDQSTADSIAQSFAQQQQQINAQYQQQQAALQQQEAVLAAQRSSSVQGQAALAQQRAVQIALIQQQDSQQQAQAEAAQEARQAALEAQQKANEQAATQRKAFATQCLRANSDFVDNGGFQHVVIQNSCSDGVSGRCSRTIKATERGGAVDSGQTREFVFKNRGAGWIRRYWGCIAKYDVSREWHRPDWRARGLLIAATAGGHPAAAKCKD